MNILTLMGLTYFSVCTVPHLHYCDAIMNILTLMGLTYFSVCNVPHVCTLLCWNHKYLNPDGSYLFFCRHCTTYIYCAVIMNILTLVGLTYFFVGTAPHVFTVL